MWLMYSLCNYCILVIVFHINNTPIVIHSVTYHRVCSPVLVHWCFAHSWACTDVSLVADWSFFSRKNRFVLSLNNMYPDPTPCRNAARLRVGSGLASRAILQLRLFRLRRRRGRAAPRRVSPAQRGQSMVSHRAFRSAQRRPLKEEDNT